MAAAGALLTLVAVLVSPALVRLVTVFAVNPMWGHRPALLLGLRLVFAASGVILLGLGLARLRAEPPDTIRAFWRTASNLSLALVSICISLVVVEAIVGRFQAREEPFDLGEIVSWQGDEYSIYTPPLNDLGFREQDAIEETLSDDLIRIVFIGNSFTFGWGVPNGADRFSDIVERRLNEELDGAYHIYNAGLPNTTPARWVEPLRTLLSLYEPGHVFAIFFLRDGTSVCTALRCHEKTIERLEAIYADNPLYRRTRLGNLLGNWLIRRDFSHYYVGLLFDGYLGDEEDTAPWRAEQAALLEMQDLCSALGVEFHLVIFPVLYRLGDDYPFDDVEEEIGRFAREAGMPLHSLTGGFLGHVDSDLWVSPSDQHPNEKGHRIAANALFPYLRDAVGLRFR